MKKLIILTVSIFLWIQSINSQTHLNLTGGIYFPLKPTTFNDEWKMGLSPGIGIGLNLSNRSIIEIRVDYNKHFYNTDKSNLHGYEINGAEILQIIPSVFYKLYPFDFDKAINPFLQLGTGYALITQNDAKIIGFNSEYFISGKKNAGMLLQFGAGVDFYLLRICKIFFTGHYGFIYTNLSEKKSIQFLSVHSGLNFIF